MTDYLPFVLVVIHMQGLNCDLGLPVFSLANYGQFKPNGVKYRGYWGTLLRRESNHESLTLFELLNTYLRVSSMLSRTC